jgi:hypothetical protein
MLPNTDVKGRAAFAKRLASQKKDDLAAIATQALEGTGWLPDVIATKRPVGVDVTSDEVIIHLAETNTLDPQYEVTDIGLEALAVADAVAPDVEMSGIAAE